MASAFPAPGLIKNPRVNLLQLGSAMTRGLGESLGKAHVLVLITAVLLTSSAVSIVGGISFVGLLAPHLVRKRVGGDMRRLVPAATAIGALLVLAADFLSRNLLAQDISGWVGLPFRTTNLPVGVYLALVGTPFFLYILRKSKHARS